MPLLGSVQFLLLSVLPGAWVAFGARMSDPPFWVRTLMAAVLSPVIVAVQFYGLRLMGADFGAVADWLVPLNLPALYLIWRKRAEASRPQRRAIVAGVLVIVFCFVAMAPRLSSVRMRLYSSHAWVYTTPSYLLERGDLVLESPEMAGVRLSHPPWGQLVHQTLLSRYLDSPPALAYAWTNLVWLILLCGLLAAIVTELGGGYGARMAAGALAALGVNPVGSYLKHVLPPLLTTGSYRISGDLRYDPALDKYYIFSSMPVALGMFVALAYLLLHRRPGPGTFAIGSVLASGIGIFYPLLFPPAAALIAAAAVADYLASGPRSLRWCVGMLAVSALFTFIHVKFTTVDYGAGLRPVGISSLQELIRKPIEAAIALSVLIASAAFAVRKCLDERRRAVVILVLAGLGSCALHAVFEIPFWQNEYKFIFTAAISIAPLAALGAARLFSNLTFGRRAAAIAGLAVFFTAPAIVQEIQRAGITRRANLPAVDTSGFHLVLSKGEQHATLAQALRECIPGDAVIAMEEYSLYYPALTGRSLYAPYGDMSTPGTNLNFDTLLGNIRGFGLRELNERRQVLRALFGPDDKQRQTALIRIQRLNRPVAIVLGPEDAPLRAWLEKNAMGRAVSQGAFTIWLVPPVNRVSPSVRAAGRGLP
jgi:hypothetical protein